MWVLLGGHGFLGQPHRREHRLLVVVQHQCQDLHHLSVVARLLEQRCLQALEGHRRLQEAGTVAQGPRLALQHCQVVMPVVDSLPRAMMVALDQALVLADDAP